MDNVKVGNEIITENLKRRNNRIFIPSKRVYIAGLYSYTETGILGIFDNMRNGMKAGLKVLKLGFAPFVPWFDYHFQLMLEDGEKLKVEDYYRYSMQWLEVSDIILVTSNNPKSKGVNGEIKRAFELNIPVVYSINQLCKYYKKCPICGTKLKNQYTTFVSFFCPNKNCKNFLQSVRFE